MIGNNLDKIEDIKKSGIYSINCSDCNKVYIGQTKRNILTRFKEHMYHIKCKNIFKSALASHWHETGHKFEQSNLKLIKSCYNKKNLNMLEAIYMNKQKENLLNFDLTPLDNRMLKLVK